MINRWPLILFVVLSALQAEVIKIAAAANVSYAIEDLVQRFEQQHPETRVRVTLGGTGKLTAQIKHGAPYQLLMAADMVYPEALYKEGLATSVPKVYARGALALLSRKSRDFTKGFSLLLERDIEKIAIANPKTAPYGKASFEALEKEGLLQQLKPKFVYGESISQTVAHTLAAADIGFVANSSLYSPKMAAYREGSHWIKVPEHDYTPIDQGMVILQNGRNSVGVKAFYRFMLSREAGSILQHYGYTLP